MGIKTSGSGCQRYILNASSDIEEKPTGEAAIHKDQDDDRRTSESKRTFLQKPFRVYAPTFQFLKKRVKKGAPSSD